MPSSGVQLSPGQVTEFAPAVLRAQPLPAASQQGLEACNSPLHVSVSTRQRRAGQTSFLTSPSRELPTPQTSPPCFPFCTLSLRTSRRWTPSTDLLSPTCSGSSSPATAEDQGGGAGIRLGGYPLHQGPVCRGLPDQVRHHRGVPPQLLPVLPPPARSAASHSRFWDKIS